MQDNGVGLTSTNVEKLFDAFYTTKNNGMGIGLSVSRSIIDSHNGRIWAEPNNGPGATFWFSIPFSRTGNNSPSAVDVRFAPLTRMRLGS